MTLWDLLVARVHLWAYEAISKANAWRERRTGWASIPVPVYLLDRGEVNITVLRSGGSFSEAVINSGALVTGLSDTEGDELEAWVEEQFGGE